MKFLFESFPILIFFIAFKVFDIFIATFAAMASSVLQIGWLLFRKQKIEIMQWVSLGLIVVFGGLTITLQDENFIKIKPTILYWLFAIVLLGSSIFLRKNLIKKAMSAQINLKPEFTDRHWQILNFYWIIFFLLMGGLNLYIAKNFSSETWTNFKLSSIGILFVFILIQGMWLGKFMVVDESSKPGK
jgi:intracellular septation protein